MSARCADEAREGHLTYRGGIRIDEGGSAPVVD